MSAISNILNDVQLRDSLIQLKQEKINIDNLELKDKLVSLLSHEDPKVRKNTAIILGQYNDMIAVLLQAYMQEETDYVKEAYLKGLESQEGLDLFIDIFKQIQSDLMNSDADAKHITAQLKILNMIIVENSDHDIKEIKDKHLPIDVLLTTLPNYQSLLLDDPKLKGCPHKEVSQGLIVKTESINETRKMRYYKEMLIPLGASQLPQEVDTIVEALKNSKLNTILERLYGEENYYYKLVDVLREKNSNFISKLSDKISDEFGTQLLNVKTKQDFDIVVKEVKKGTVSLYLRPNIKDKRFGYRKEVIASSIQPYIAAVLLKLFKPYIKEDASVYDPFCGVGTMLIERYRLSKPKFMVGTDIYNDGIEIAKRNTKITKYNINYVHKDALRYETEELFDEMITDMPTIAQSKDEASCNKTYQIFFNRIKELVKVDGVVGIYTLEDQLVNKYKTDDLELLQDYSIKRGKNIYHFFIFKVK